MQSKVKVVVTGASGFLGKQIAHNLRMHNQLEVVAVTRKKLDGWFIVNDYSGGVVVRASNLYGIGMSDANVVNKIFSQIPGKGPLKIINDKPIRDFLYIQDAVSGIISLLIYYLNHSGGGIYNLGTGIGTSIRSLASLSLKMAGESHRIIESESVSNANSCLVVNCNETTKICGWKPNVKLSEGISNIIEQRNI